MKTKNYSLSLLFLMMSIAITSCSHGRGDIRDRNIEQAILTRLDSIPGIQYVGMSDARIAGDDKFQAIIIYDVTDSVGKRTEYNARVTTNDDCSEIYVWENLDSHVLEDIKQRVREKFAEKGICLNGSLIDALIELREF